MISLTKHKGDKVDAMALFIRQDEEQSNLRSKVNAELQDRMRKTGKVEHDDVEKESHLVKNQHTTSKSGIVIAVLAVLAVAFILYMLRP